MTVVWLATGLGAMFRCTVCGRQAQVAATGLPALLGSRGDVAAWCEECARRCCADAASAPVDGAALEVVRELSAGIRAVLPLRGEPT